MQASSPEADRAAQLRATLTRLSQEIPVFGRFVAVANSLDEISRRAPKERQSFRREVIERAALLIERSQGEFEQCLAVSQGEVLARLDAVEELAAGRADETLVEHLLEATINEGLIGAEDLTLAEFAARHLDERDLRILLHYFDREMAWQEADLRSLDRPSLSGLTLQEAGYRLGRLRDSGFFTSDPADVQKPLAWRSFETDLEVVDDFCRKLNLVRIIEFAPSLELPGIAEAEKNSRLETFVRELSSLYRGRLSVDGAAVRRHILEGYQGTLRTSSSDGQFRGGYATVGEARAEATQAMETRGFRGRWVQVAV